MEGHTNTLSEDDRLTTLQVASRIVGMQQGEIDYWTHRFTASTARFRRFSVDSPMYKSAGVWAFETPDHVETMWREWIEKWPTMTLEVLQKTQWVRASKALNFHNTSKP